MNKLVKHSSAIFLLLLSVNLYSQQEFQLSTYFFNPSIINAAYAGSQKTLIANATVRDQWTNFNGAPKSQVITLHSPLKNERIGLGFSLLNDKIGAHTNKYFSLDLSVNVKLNKKGHYLSAGIKPGIDFYQTNFTNTKVQDKTDNVYINGLSSSVLLPNLGAGLYYYTNKFYLGASTPRILKNEYSVNNTQISVQKNHMYVFAGYVATINSAVKFKPSCIFKYVANAPVSADANVSFLFYDKVWLGAMYRYNSAAGVNMMYYLTNNFTVGYAFDYTLNQIQKYSAGSHEVMLSYKLKSKTKGFTSPRYF